MPNLSIIASRSNSVELVTVFALGLVSVALLWYCWECMVWCISSGAGVLVYVCRFEYPAVQLLGVYGL